MRRDLALQLLEVLGAPLGPWRCSNAAARAADAADMLPPELAAALAALDGPSRRGASLAVPSSDTGPQRNGLKGQDPCPNIDPQGVRAAAKGSRRCGVAWLSPDGFYGGLSQGREGTSDDVGALGNEGGGTAAVAADSMVEPASAAGAAPGEQPIHPAPAWFQVRALPPPLEYELCWWGACSAAC